MNHLSEEELILIYYGEAGAPTNAGTHLAECAECRSAADALARTLQLCDELPVPERGPEFGRDVWNRLLPELGEVPLPVRHGWRGWRVLAASAAFAVVLMAVFLAGRYSRSVANGTPMLAGLSDQARERVLAIAVADHLERVQILLTEMENSDTANPARVVSDKYRAEDLVQEGRLMRQSLAAQGESATTNFLDEVERFLIEAAHTPEGATADEVRDLRDRIESGSLLFKVRVVESNLRSEEQKL